MRLKEMREERHLTQNEVAQQIQTSQINIGRWEKGLNEPTASFLVRLADFFNCSVDYLLGREDDFGNVVVQTEKPAPLPQDEQDLLETYRKLDTQNKMHVSIYAEVRLEEQKKEVETDLEKAVLKGRRCGLSDEEIRSLFELILEDL